MSQLFIYARIFDQDQIIDIIFQNVHYRPTLGSIHDICNQLFDKWANYDAFWDRKQYTLYV